MKPRGQPSAGIAGMMAKNRLTLLHVIDRLRSVMAEVGTRDLAGMAGRKMVDDDDGVGDGGEGAPGEVLLDSVASALI